MRRVRSGQKMEYLGNDEFFLKDFHGVQLARPALSTHHHLSKRTLAQTFHEFKVLKHLWQSSNHQLSRPSSFLLNYAFFKFHLLFHFHTHNPVSITPTFPPPQTSFFLRFGCRMPSTWSPLSSSRLSDTDNMASIQSSLCK